ncbi:RPM1 interacting protein 13-like isoform X3 [Phragmites australis]|uniref:RPM1 interacting protein 13-like isoform X3 n=1 Tax=Phragmites australis TaxID=29695 RepID=UPI002D776186|nr:RPM1 interacting protein 13-like isoform X3 [Phragmites australis]
MARGKRSAPAPAAPVAKAKKPPPAPVAPANTAAAANVIEIPSSPDPSVGGSAKKARKRSAPLDLDDEIEMWTPREKRRLDEDCQILATDPIAAAEVAPATPAAASDDVAVVAERGKVACRDYPHPRSACAKHPFNITPHERHCGKCFYFVCDIAAPCVLEWWKTMRSFKKKISVKRPI